MRQDNLDTVKYSTFDIGKAFGIPRERFRDWMNRGFIDPSVKAEGQGTKAGFSTYDAYGIGLFMKLLEKGFKRKQASELAKQFVEARQYLMNAQYVVITSIKTDEGNVLKPRSLHGMVELTIKVRPDAMGFGSNEKEFGAVEAKEVKWNDFLVINFARYKHEWDTMLREVG